MDFKESVYLIIQELSSNVSKSLMTKSIESSSKNLDLCIRARELGNEKYRAEGHDVKSHKKILKYYSKSLAFAPSNSEHLAIAYGNKSVLLLHLKQFEDCVKDIDRALKLAITPNILRVKLLCRKLECFVAMGNLEGKQEIRDEIGRYLVMIDDDEDKEKLEKIVERVDTLMSKEKVEVPRKLHFDKETEHQRVRDTKESKGMFDIIRMSAYDKNGKYGHHLIATEDILPGRLIFLSKPYTSIVNVKKFQSYCAHCVDVLWSSVPCENCSRSLYCSEKCRNKANKRYHKFECGCLPFILCDGLLDHQAHMALRSVIMAVEEFGSIEALMKVVEDIDNMPEDKKGFDSNGKFNQSSFRSFFKFKNINVGPTVLHCFVQASCRSVIALARCTSFFGDAQQFKKIDDLLNNINVLFIANLLLRISLIVFKNGEKIKESSRLCKNGKDQETCNSSVPCCERGYCINMIDNFIFHSCNPNVRSVMIEGGKSLWYALQPINEKEPGNMMTYQEMVDLMVENVNNRKNCGTFEIVIGEKERYIQKSADDMTRVMDAMFEIEKQPSKLLCSMICILRFVMDRLHGVKIRMPNDCRILPS